ncbi:hypothetical protein [Aliivibrio sifiae]|uniref:Uncharacterized protein n=1 Tax=Aliivibrio sifiae TaxID=566293 RepID=A0A2S7X6I5_9GAMM|nr:hypothetical protein [Aliivibrio sifiae]PQJ86745.1 hypothetical protein BTO23_11400 [Aliivibrio sifiae]GLR74150.1 hypothetical protein GCM10007855_10240 [Aliivibrio sifiae]
MKVISFIVFLFLFSTTFAQANVHKWKNKTFETYSDKTQVQFVLVNRYNQSADYYLRIDNKSFPTKLTLKPNQEIELDITVKTPPSQTTKKKVCTRMVSDSPNSYEVCTNLSFKRH